MRRACVRVPFGFRSFSPRVRGRDDDRAGTAPAAAAGGLRRAFPAGTAGAAIRRARGRSARPRRAVRRSEEHTSELQSLMRISYAVFCLKKKKNTIHDNGVRITQRKE